MKEFKVGDKVHYVDYNGFENGIVKSLHPTNDQVVYVVYKCGGDWANYKNYTAASTNIHDLKTGWL